MPKPIAYGADVSDAILVLFGTGIQNRSSLQGVSVAIGGERAEVLYAGPQGQYAGLDQVNVRIPRSAAGRGDVSVQLSADGVAANPVTINVR